MQYRQTDQRPWVDPAISELELELKDGLNMYSIFS